MPSHRQTHPTTALCDRAVEEALRLRRADERAHHDRASGFTGNRDVVRIATEGADVLLDPLQRGGIASIIP